MTGLANLGMYDAPWLQAANDALWAALRLRLATEGLADIPARLERERPLPAIWRDPALLLGQTCGYPLVTTLRDMVTVVARPVYDLGQSRPGFHRSFVVVRREATFTKLEDLRGARLGLNGFDSNTGMNLLRRLVAPLAQAGHFFGTVTETGAHLQSLAAVARGDIDTAAIDGVTFGLAARHRPNLVAEVRVIAETPESPTLPFITAGGADVARVAALRRALAAVITDPANAETCAALGLAGIQPASFEDYALLQRYEAEAAAMGYSVLA